MVCQNQSLFDSRAPIVISLRNEIYDQVIRGKTETEILRYVSERYGNSILYQPPFNQSTILLWGGPIIMLLVACIVFCKFIKRSKYSSSFSIQKP